MTQQNTILFPLFVFSLLQPGLCLKPLMPTDFSPELNQSKWIFFAQPSITKHKLASGDNLLSHYFAIKLRAVMGYSDRCPSGTLSHFDTGSLELSQSGLQVLGHLFYWGPSPAKPLPFLGATVLVGTFSAAAFSTAFPGSVPHNKSVSEL